MRRISRIWPLFALILSFGVAYGYLFAARDADVPRLVQTAGGPSALEGIEISYCEKTGITAYGDEMQFLQRKISFFNGETEIERVALKSFAERLEDWQIAIDWFIHQQISLDSETIFEMSSLEKTPEERAIWEKVCERWKGGHSLLMEDDSMLVLYKNNEATALFRASLDQEHGFFDETCNEYIRIELLALEEAPTAERTSWNLLDNGRILYWKYFDDRVVLQLRTDTWELLEEVSFDGEIYRAKRDESGENPIILLTLLDSEEEQRVRSYCVFEVVNDRLIERYSVQKTSQEWQEIGLDAGYQPFCWYQERLFGTASVQNEAGYSISVSVLDENGELAYQGKISDHSEEDRRGYYALDRDDVMRYSRSQSSFAVTSRREEGQ